MFDIGFSELMVIGLIALIVIGPERLPRVARTIGHLVGRMQRYVADVKSDINREMELEDLRKMRDSVQSAAADIRSSMNTVSADLAKMESEMNSSVAAITAEASAPASPTPPPDPSPLGASDIAPGQGPEAPPVAAGSARPGPAT